MNDNGDSILIFCSDEAEASPPVVRRGLGDAMKIASVKASEVAVSTLQENMRSFLSALDTIIGDAPQNVGGLTLDEVEIHAHIDSKGKVGISAIVGAEVAVQGGITFVLRKKL